MNSSAITCLTCPICKNILTAPMILPCSHNFCSFCIRQQNSQQKGSLTCPACNSPCRAGLTGLIKNSLLEELIHNLNLGGVNVNVNPTNNSSTQTDNDKLPLDSLSNVTPYPKPRDRNLNHHHHHRDLDQSDQHSHKKIKTESTAMSRPSIAENDIVVCPLCDAGVKVKHINAHMDNKPKCKTLIVKMPSLPPPPPPLSHSRDQDQDQDDELKDIADDDEKDGDFILDAPLSCSQSSATRNSRSRRLFFNPSVVKHVDEIIDLDPDTTAPAPLPKAHTGANVPAPDHTEANVPAKDPRKYLPYLAYTQLKDKQIRAACDSAGISSKGDRALLQKRYLTLPLLTYSRHTQWTNLYNANLDCAPALRKSDPELRLELAEWDKSRAAPRVHATTIDSSKHMRDNADQFAEMVEKIRAARLKKGKKVVADDDSNATIFNFLDS